jgi:hypothetical protein
MIYMDFTDCPVAPGTIAKIATNSAGGWTIKIDIPQTAEEVVKQLIGSENTRVYSIGFADQGALPESPKRLPGRPKK